MKDNKGDFYVPNLEMGNIISTRFHQPEPSFMVATNCKVIWKIQFSCVPKKEKKQSGKHTVYVYHNHAVPKDN